MPKPRYRDGTFRVLLTKHTPNHFCVEGVAYPGLIYPKPEVSEGPWDPITGWNWNTVAPEGPAHVMFLRRDDILDITVKCAYDVVDDQGNHVRGGEVEELFQTRLADELLAWGDPRTDTQRRQLTDAFFAEPRTECLQRADACSSITVYYTRVFDEIPGEDDLAGFRGVSVQIPRITVCLPVESIDVDNEPVVEPSRFKRMFKRRYDKSTCSQKP